MKCPSCQSENTQTIKMVYLSGSSTGRATAVGLDNHGDLAVAQLGSKSQTNLAASFNPGRKPFKRTSIGEIGCGFSLVIFGLICMLDRAVVLGIVVLVIAIALIKWGKSTVGKKEARFATETAEWEKKKATLESGWICLKCGHNWIPTQQ